ncbi:MAG: polyphosphate kinase 2, partial [Gammaproteobacteria bacterium]|nr:polyphosphate kinase 2 [Gammaproteobacteria bacterium]
MAKKHKKSAAEKQAGKSRHNKPEKLSSKDYEKELEKLQGELVKLQFWVRKKGAKVIVIFEGR